MVAYHDTGPLEPPKIALIARNNFSQLSSLLRQNRKTRIRYPTRTVQQLQFVEATVDKDGPLPIQFKRFIATSNSEVIIVHLRLQMPSEEVVVRLWYGQQIDYCM